MNTNSTINAQVFQCLSYIADDENYMKKALRSLKRIMAQKVASSVVCTDPKSIQEFRKDIEEVCKQMEDAKAGKIKGTPLNDFLNEL